MMSNTEVKRVDLSKYGGPTFIGRPLGEKVRDRVGLDELDKDSSVTLEIDVPEDTYNLNSSFFLGLFGPSIRTAGSKDNFLGKYKFNTHGKKYKAIERGIERALVRNKGIFTKD